MMEVQVHRLKQVFNMQVCHGIGLAETHQTLKLNDLRSRVKLETDGKLLTGKDSLCLCAWCRRIWFHNSTTCCFGGIMMRVCHNDMCPVGVATKRFKSFV